MSTFSSLHMLPSHNNHLIVSNQKLSLRLLTQARRHVHIFLEHIRQILHHNVEENEATLQKQGTFILPTHAS